MKKLCMIVAAALLLAAGVCAGAESGVYVEVMKADGVSVVVLTPTETVPLAKGPAGSGTPEEQTGLVLPESLAVIGERAFEGIAAKRVEISEHVAAIGAYAFAGSEALREIYIPATVEKIDHTALDGCRDVTVYGTAGSAAERFAKAAGFRFVDPDGGSDPGEGPLVPGGGENPPAELPLVPRT